MSNEPKTIVLIDGHASIHRAYHAIKETLTNSKGEPTGAIFTFLNLFMKLYKQLKFEHVVVVFDPPGPSFRGGMYEEYKANRKPTPEDLKRQEVRIRQMLDLMRVPVVEMPGFEADDVIGSMALKAVKAGGEALICSVDKDLMQMVQPGIRIWRDHLNKVEILDEVAVVQKMGIRPSQIPDYLAIIGDTADNIPGVKGVGEGSAVPLLQMYGDLEGVLAATQEIRATKGLIRGAASVADKLDASAEVARLSLRLARLNLECSGDFDWRNYEWAYLPDKALRDFFQDMEFHSFVKEIGGERVEERTTDYRTITTRAELEGVVAEIRKAGRSAIDTETTDIDPMAAELVGVSLSWRKNQAVYIPLGHRGAVQVTLDDLRGVLGPALRDPAIQWIAHHWNYDYKVLKNAKLNPGDVASDTMLAGYLVNPDRSGSLRLKEMALAHLGVQMTEISELIGGGDDMVTMASVGVEDSARYACQDADMTLQLHDYFLPKLEEAGLLDLYRNIELPLITVLADMETEGVRIDKEHFQHLSRNSAEELDDLRKEIYGIAGRTFNLNSPKQVGEILFDELKLPGGKRGKTGAYSTDVSVLESLSDLHPLPSKMVDYRQVEKLKSTYIDTLPELVQSNTGRIHTSYNQTVAATGRLSSNSPNLQNIPVRTEAGRAIRRGFLPRDPKWKLMAADYSQIELRILASLSGDAALVDAFRTGGDIHALTASKVMGIPVAELTSEQRNQAKAINFGIIYGMSDFRLSKDLGISRAKARQFMDEYFQVYSGVKDYIEKTKQEAREKGYVTTLLGRRRYIPDIRSSNANTRGFGERVAVNAPIQGTSADMIKVAMIKIARDIAKEKMSARMILQVHDELIFDCPEEEVEKLHDLVKEDMTNAMTLKVPIRVDIEVGDNWSEI
ncbi:DNA polymerase I [Candidatus Sumerlaeota bacterium]|nr:DNA polymerase I [Candidatus Sumerlaeota bacterium]